MYSRRQQICNFQLLLITINNCALIHNLSSSILLSLHDKMQTDQNVSNTNAKSLNIPFLPTRRNHTNMFLITDPSLQTLFCSENLSPPTSKRWHLLWQHTTAFCKGQRWSYRAVILTGTSSTMWGKKKRQTFPEPTITLIHCETGFPFELYQISTVRKFNSAYLQKQPWGRDCFLFAVWPPVT